MLNRPQSGQALVGVLVVMILIFLLAGAVSVGAGSLLTRMRTTGSDVTDDFAVQGAVAAAASHAASQTNPTTGCLTSSGSTFPIPLPSNPPGQASTGSQTGRCVGFSGMSMNAFSRVDVGPWLNGCSTTDITAYQNNNVSIFFDRRWQLGQNTAAYVEKAPTTGTVNCLATPTLSNRVCLAPAQAAIYPPVAFQCQLPTVPSGTGLYLVISSGTGQPKQAFFVSSPSAGSQTNTGFLYLTVAGTGLPSPRDYEEGHFYLQNKTAQLQLLYEAPLP